MGPTVVWCFWFFTDNYTTTYQNVVVHCPHVQEILEVIELPLGSVILRASDHSTKTLAVSHWYSASQISLPSF